MGSTSRHQKEVRLHEAEDRISNLPKSLTGHILSFLPTKYAVSTSILSSKWKWMWTSINNLDFDAPFFHFCENSDQREKRFIKFVYRVLLLLEGSNMNKFRFRCSGFSDVSHVNAWVTAALSHNVRELDLYIPLESSLSLPAELFTSDKLAVLKLYSYFVLNIPRLVCLKNLKTLHLRGVEFRDQESVKRLISNCPLLEVLALLQCGGKNVSVVNISAPALKTLTLEYPVPNIWESTRHFGCSTYDGCPYKIELNTPSLLHLEYEGLVAEGFAMNNLSSLVEAHIDFELCDEQSDARYITSMAELLRGISNVQTLRMSGNCIETLPDSYGSKLPVFHNLTSLELGVTTHVRWNLLPHLLECSPNLRTLVFKEGLLRANSYFEEWYPPECVPTCLLVSLEKIDLRRFLGDERELKVIEYFLINAKALKILNLWYDKNHMEEEEAEVSKKLLEMPRGSTCKVVVLRC